MDVRQVILEAENAEDLHTFITTVDFDFNGGSFLCTHFRYPETEHLDNLRRYLNAGLNPHAKCGCGDHESYCDYLRQMYGWLERSGEDDLDMLDEVIGICEEYPE